MPQAGTLQKAFPGQIVEYKANCCGMVKEGLPDGKGGGRLPPNARVICFPLEPKPHEVEEDWVQLLWCGGMAGLSSRNA